MCTLLAVTAACLSPPQAAGQSPRHAISGQVVDASSGQPIPGVELHAGSGTLTSFDRNDGRFRLVLRTPRDTLHIRAIGYFPVHLVVDIGDTGFHRVMMRTAPTTLPDLVAIGGLRARPAAEMVMPVARLVREAIEDGGAATVGEAMRGLPGVQLTTTPPTGSGIMIRGIGDGRVLILRDGQPAPGQMLEDRDLSRLSTAGVEQVEVVKGPLSVAHGSNALGGVINIISRAPNGPLAFDASVRDGTLGRREADLALQAGGRIAWRASAGWRQQDRLPGQPEQGGVFQRVLDLHGSARTTIGRVALRLDADGFRERQRWPVGGGFFGFNDNRGGTLWSEAALEQWGGLWQLRVTGQEYRHRFRQALGTLPYEGSGPPTQQERLVRVQLGHSRHVGTHHQVDLGVETSRRRVVATDRLVGERISDRLVEGWLQDAITIGPTLVTAAARVSESGRWGTTLTPSLGVAIEPTARLRVRVGAARGFRSPSFKELGWQFMNPAAGYVVEGNPALIPESSWQLFAGATWSPTPRLTADVDLYRNALRDMIDLVPVGTTSGGLTRYTPMNRSRARTQGLELAMRYRVRDLQLALSYDRLAAMDRQTGAPLDRRIPHAARLQAVQEIGRATRVVATGRWSSEAPITDAGGTRLATQGGLLAWDVAFRLAPRDGVTLEAGIDNLLDARPRNWLLPLHRTMRVGVRMHGRP